jgi:hypothetical protein
MMKLRIYRNKLLRLVVRDQVVLEEAKERRETKRIRKIRKSPRSIVRTLEEDWIEVLITNELNLLIICLIDHTYVIDTIKFYLL